MVHTNEAPVTVEQQLLARADECRRHAEASRHPEACSEYRAKEAAFREAAGLAAIATTPDGDEDAIAILNGIIRDMRSALQAIANDEGDTCTGQRCLAAIGRSRVPTRLIPSTKAG